MSLHTTAEELEKLEKVFVNPEKVEERVTEMVRLMKKTHPTVTDEDMKMIQRAAVKYAKETLKGKAAVLYGMSLDWAITALSDEDMDLRTKKDLVIKVLGHCLPTEVHLSGGDDTTQPILFTMERPYVEEKEPIEVDAIESNGTGEVDPSYQEEILKTVN